MCKPPPTPPMEGSFKDLDLKMKNSIENQNIKISKKVKDLTGVISLPKDFDYKKAISEYLWEKYLKLDD